MKTPNLDRYAHRKVCDVAAIPGPASAELFALAMGDRKVWTYPTWNTRLAELDACEETVDDWRVLNS